MGSSNMGVVSTGDIESQQDKTNWFAKHKYMLRPDQENEENKLGFFILKVPEYWRQPSQAFSPQGWQFGLHNRENLDKSGSEAIKLGIAVQYGLVGEKWDHFCNAIVDDSKAILACYGLQNGMTKWTNEQIKHVLALDAFFLAHLFYLGNERQVDNGNALPSSFTRNDVVDAQYNMWEDFIGIDLCRVENQVPLVLIDKVVDYIINYVPSLTSSKSNEPPIVDLSYQQRSSEYMADELASYFMTTSSEAFKIDNSCLFSERIHIFGTIYNTICGSKGLGLKGKWNNIYIHIPSATKLEQSRIKIIGVEGPLCTMSYEEKCLHLPKMKIYDDTIFFVRNMAFYEARSIPGGCLFNDYIALMMDLIQTQEDLDLLIKRKVIENGCGIKAFGMWKALDEGLAGVWSSNTHHNMKKDIVSRCDHRRYKLWDEFQVVFCSKPWLILSTIAVVLVTVATLVQTYIAIIGSNEMKPKFP